MKHLPITFLLLTLSLASPVADAQTFQSLGGETGNVIVSTEPSEPSPNQYVTVSVESYATDLNRALISWFQNGKLEKEAIGQKTFLLKTGSLGTVSNILIVIKTAEGETLQKALSVRPGALDLVWEAESYTPPFYRGKALYPFQGTVKVVALPNIVTETGAVLNPKNLVYTWTVDGDAVARISGYGKNFMFFNGSVPLGPATIEVEAASLDKKYRAKGSVILNPQGSEVLFYEDNPIYGVLYNKTLRGNVTLQNEEIRITGIPYYIGAKERENNSLRYEWQLNNQNVGGGSAKSSLSFKQSADAGGTALVALQVSNPAKIFQFASNNLSLTFGKTAAVNLFETP